jgi:hypothetical protein
VQKRDHEIDISYFRKTVWAPGLQHPVEVVISNDRCADLPSHFGQTSGIRVKLLVGRHD